MVPRYCAVAPMDGACCRSWARPDRSTIPGITREGFAASPAECEATCFATTGCQAFSHSFTQRQCVLCSDCDELCERAWAVGLRGGGSAAQSV